jgi:predicted nucleotidyltransferase
VIEQILPCGKAKLKIISEIYENPGTNITGLINRAKTSPNLVISYVNELVDCNIITERRIGGKKKAHIRVLKPNFDSELAILVFGLIETDKKFLFFKKYKNLKPVLEQVIDLFDRNVKFSLIYGSFARFAATKASDLDILIVGKIDKEMKKRIIETFVTIDREVSLKTEPLSQFLKNIRKPLYQSIIKEHILLHGQYSFLKEVKACIEG